MASLSDKQIRHLRAQAHLAYLVEDIGKQLDQLVHGEFLSDVPLRWLRQYPRYFSAMQQRLDKLQGNLARDRRDGQAWSPPRH